MATPAIPAAVRTAMRHALVAGVPRPEIAAATGTTRVTVWRYTRDLVAPHQAAAEERAARRLALIGLGLTTTAVGRREGCTPQAISDTVKRHRARLARHMAEAAHA